MLIPTYATPKTDKILQIYSFKTKEGLLYNDMITPWQKVIMETILTRKAPDGSGKNRIHIMAHTRYGKSLAVGAAVAVRASSCSEPWVILAGTKEQAQIIMDHVIQFVTNDPLMRSMLVQSADNIIKDQKKRTYITFANGGSVRAFTTGPDGDAVMGQGCKNVIQDESALVSDNANSKVERMLGDDPHDNFLVKIGNPFNNNHFKQAYKNENYFHINIDYRVGLHEGRLTEQFLAERRSQPNFSVLYENLFPDDEAADQHGYLPLITQATLERAMIDGDSVQKVGTPLGGADPADGGSNEAVICKRWMNVAEIVLRTTEMDSVSFATPVAHETRDCFQVGIDVVGVGSGTYNTLKYQQGTKERMIPVRSGEPVPKDIEDRDLYKNLRAYIFWQVKTWLESGGRLVRSEVWKGLLDVRYKTSVDGKIQIISKDELKKYYQVDDLGVPDALSLTFAPRRKVYTAKGPVGGVNPLGGAV